MSTNPSVESRPPAPADPMIGPVDAGPRFGPQSYADTCAIRCQEYVIECFTGQDVDEDALVEEAKEMGWYTPDAPGTVGGTPLEAVGNLLECHGIPTNRYINANVYHLTAELAQGHKVILGVDSEVLRQDNPILSEIRSTFDIGDADHAVIVSGIDTTDPDDPSVIVSDPLSGEAAARYSLNKFLTAWSTSEFFMVATTEPAPPWLPEMANFDYEAGHLSSVAGIPYDEIVQMEDAPDTLAAQLDEAASDPGHDSRSVREEEAGFNHHPFDDPDDDGGNGDAPEFDDDPFGLRDPADGPPPGVAHAHDTDDPVLHDGMEDHGYLDGGDDDSPAGDPPF